MKYSLYFTFLLILCTSVTPKLFAQDDNFLTFDIMNAKPFEHGISDVEVLDKRSYKSDTLGVIKAGKMNGKRPLLSSVHFTKGIENYYKSLSAGKNSVDNKKLMVLVYNFEANELSTGFTDENAAFSFAADYFIEVENGGYKMLGTVDTVIKVSSLDVTKKLIRTIDQSLCALYEWCYTTTPRDTTRYSYADVVRFDLLEKNALPAFSADTIPNGVYLSWKDFLKLNKKDSTTIVKGKKRFKVEAYTKKGKQFHTSLPEGTEVIGYRGSAYYNLGGIFYPMTKKDNDYYFTGRAWKNTRRGSMIATGMMFGAAGVLIFMSTETPIGYDGTFLAGVLYDFKIEHRTGKTILLNKVMRTGTNFR